LLLFPTTTYRSADYLRAAARLGVEAVVASEHPSTMERLNPDGLLTLDFREPEACARAAAALAERGGVEAAIGVDEPTALAAARVGTALGLARVNPPEAVAAAGDKRLFRERIGAAGLPAPGWVAAAVPDGPGAALARARLPCVLKPTFLSGSRGVIRAGSPEEFRAAWDRVAAILDDPEVARRGGENARTILVEDYVPGEEVALEGLLRGGALETLAIFDKPDPLEGPFFAETIYVTPSRKRSEVQDAIRGAAAAAARALGLRHGPIHAELRLPPSGPVVIELAARTIGGLCSRALRFAGGATLEDVVLRHALGRDGGRVEREAAASGVLMIPVDRAGRLETVGGVEAARAVPGVEDVVISAHPGQTLVPLPEEARYVGFVFARAAEPAAVETALRESRARLDFRIV
jgi:biotin carboxylase